MKQNLLKSFIAVLISIVCMTASAHDFEVDGIYYKITSADDLTVAVSFKGEDSYVLSITYTGSVTIPQTVKYSGKTYRVTSIGDHAFKFCSDLTSVTIPNGVTSIGEFAFDNCSALTSVNIPNSVTSIGEFAFSECSALTSVTIPNSVTYIGRYAFDSCCGLTSIVLPENLAEIGDGAFYACSGLTTVSIPKSVTSIGEAPFDECDGLISIVVESGNTVYDSREDCNAIIETATKALIQGCKNTTIPNSVTEIAILAFSGCTGLTSITIPSSVIKIGAAAFYYCGLTEIVIPYSVTTIEETPFVCCMELTSIVVESGNTVYDSRDNCNAIIETSSNTLIQGCKESTIPNSVTKIGYSAFAAFDGLTSITIPSSVVYIDEEAFAECYNLSDLYCYCTVVPETGLDYFNGSCNVFSYTPIDNATLHVPAASLDAYKSTEPWSEFGTIVALTDEEMGVEQLTMGNGQLIMKSDTYDLNGRRIAKPTKGIYVRNGKKVVIK